jgi:hypothetical protein
MLWSLRFGFFPAHYTLLSSQHLVLGYVHSGTSPDMTRMYGIIASQYESMEMTRTVHGPIDFSINTVDTEE